MGKRTETITVRLDKRDREMLRQIQEERRDLNSVSEIIRALIHDTWLDILEARAKTRATGMEHAAGGWTIELIIDALDFEAQRGNKLAKDELPIWRDILEMAKKLEKRRDGP